jgi:hypothetical protein
MRVIEEARPCTALSLLASIGNEKVASQAHHAMPSSIIVRNIPGDTTGFQQFEWCASQETCLEW